MSDYPFTVNGNAYDLTSFAGFAYVANLPEAMKDMVLQALMLHTATSSSSVLIGTGAKSLTVQAGRAFQPGDHIYIASSAAPQTNRMYGTVNTYNFATGALNVTVLGTYGSGTLSSWLVGLGGASVAASASDYMLALDQGGTGYGRSSFVLPANFLGLGDPSSSMKEIYEEFAGSQGETTSSGNTGTVKPPWYVYNNPALDVGAVVTGATLGTINAGQFLLECDSFNGVSASAILQYSQNCFFHVGKGATVFETNLFGVAANSDYWMRCGLKAHNSGFTTNIFSAGGIGFEAYSGKNNGRFILVCGTTNRIKTINTGILPSATHNKLRIEIDHDGYRADFYINESFAGSIEDYCPTNGPNNLLAPAFECQLVRLSSNVYVTTAYYIDSMMLRKHLVR